MNENLKNIILPPASQTGRFTVHSAILNRTFVVEPLLDHPDNIRMGWGDINPATKKLEGGYGDKYEGAIEMKDSIITKENGFHDIHELKVGESPLGYIERLEKRISGKTIKAMSFKEIDEEKINAKIEKELRYQSALYKREKYRSLVIELKASQYLKTDDLVRQSKIRIERLKEKLK